MVTGPFEWQTADVQSSFWTVLLASVTLVLPLLVASDRHFSTFLSHVHAHRSMPSTLTRTLQDQLSKTTSALC